MDLKDASLVSPPDAPVTILATRDDTLDLSQATKVTPPEAPIKKMPEITRAGVDLVKWVLVIISVFVLLEVCWILTSEIFYTLKFNELTVIQKPDTPVPTADALKEVLTQVQTARADFREFWIKIFQMVLLNVLLPVLTALLGYVFGSRHPEA